MAYLEYLNKTCPVRNTAEEKAAFRDWAVKEAEGLGYKASTEEKEKHCNVVLGDPERASVLFTAHYDTPRRSLTPNLMLPTNKALFWAYNIGIGVLLAVIALLGSRLISHLSGHPISERTGWMIWYISYIVLFVALFKLVLFGPKNKFNYNDNTSGTAAVMALAARLKGSDKAAFILFDDEEKGKKGSKAYVKAHPEINEKALVVNLDCVANGEHFIICASKDAMAREEYAAFSESWQSRDGFETHLYDARKIAMNSDQKSFKNGIGVCACHRYKAVGYCTPRIHTRYDTVAREENIAYLADTLESFVRKL